MYWSYIQTNKQTQTAFTVVPTQKYYFLSLFRLFKPHQQMLLLRPYFSERERKQLRQTEREMKKPQRKQNPSLSAAAAAAKTKTLLLSLTEEEEQLKINQRLSETSSASSSSSSSSSSISIPSTFSVPSSSLVYFSTSRVEKTSSSSSSSTCSSSSSPFSFSFTVTALEEPPCSREGGGQESVTIERHGNHSALCKWTIHNFSKLKSRALWSRYFEVGGFDCRLLVYPKGDSQSLPGYCSIYLQIMDPRASSSAKWDCFASYRLSIVNILDESKSERRDAWYRYSSKKKSHGWCDFALISTLVDPKFGFISTDDDNDSVVVTADVLILKESVSFCRDNNNHINDLHQQQQQPSSSSSTVVSSSSSSSPASELVSGKFTWKVHNFGLFKDMIKTQKIMSPAFPAGECNLRISVYQTSVNGIKYLSMCLESKEIDKAVFPDRSCWCLFRMSVMNQKPGLNHMHRDSYGRFATDNRGGDNTSFGWNDYMKMSDFTGPELGFLVDDTAVFTASFHVIKESGNFTKYGGLLGGRSMGGGRKSDGYIGKFTWRIDNFTRLKDLLKKKKITGLSIKSKKFQIGDRDCRLIVYPRGQSHPPSHLSLFLEVTDSRYAASDWSCFVSHRLSVVNQRMEDKSIVKESQNRYSKAVKDWGWHEFVTLNSLFDQDSGFLVQDSIVFSAEVLILKESAEIQVFSGQDLQLSNAGGQTEVAGAERSFTWKVENCASFKEIIETRKIFSKFFQVGGFELRIGVFESCDTIYMYLESDQSAGIDPDKNFWVRYKMGVVNQKKSDKTLWKESSIFTNTWKDSVLKFMKVSDMLEGDAGFLLRDTTVFVCYIMDCCPWFEFSDLEVLAFEDDRDALSTDLAELIDSEDTEGISGDDEDIFRNHARTGFHLTFGGSPSQPRVSLEKLLMDAGAIAGYLTGLRVYLDDPDNVRRLLRPARLSGSNDGKKEDAETDESSPSVINMLMGIEVLQPEIIDLLLDIMINCCQPSEGTSGDALSDTSSKPSSIKNGPVSPPSESGSENVEIESLAFPLHARLDSRAVEDALQCLDMSKISINEKSVPGQPISPSASSASTLFTDSNSIRASKTKWPEQSEELLGLIVSSLSALDGGIPQGCTEPRRQPHSAKKIALVLDKAPRHLQPNLVALVPKLVGRSEHPAAARALLDWLYSKNSESDIQIPVMSAISELEFGSEVWKSVLYMSFRMLGDSDQEKLAATISFIFNVASRSQELVEAVRTIRARLERLGAEMSSCVLDMLSKTMKTYVDVAEAMLRDIRSNFELDETSIPFTCWRLMLVENGVSAEKSNATNKQLLETSRHFSDIFMLIDMLSITGLAIEAHKVFEAEVANGAITHQSVAMVLERRYAERSSISSRYVTDYSQRLKKGKISESLPVQDDDFIPLLGLAEALTLSRDSRVQVFVRMLYAILLRMYAGDGYTDRMLRGLIDRVTSSSTTDNHGGLNSDLDILVSFVREEEGIARPVLTMMQEASVRANVNCTALKHQLSACEDEKFRVREEMQAELSSVVRKKNDLSKRLCESEATTDHVKSEMRAEIDHLYREKKDLSEQLQNAKIQLEWIHLEQEDEIVKMSSEKKVLQDQVRDLETQLAHLKSRQDEELKRVVKEKKVLSERLKTAEAARKRFEEEFKQYASEIRTHNRVRQSLEAEVRRLTQTVGQAEGEKREKEEQVTRCEAYVEEMKEKLLACQQYIHNQDTSLREEMARHAPLYGVGLEALSMSELDTLSSIHAEGLRMIHAVRLRNRIGAGRTLVTSPHSLAHHHHGLHTTSPPSVAQLRSSNIRNATGSPRNEPLNSAVRPRFNPS